MKALYQSGKIKNIEIKNRIIMSPISISLGTKEKKVSPETIAFYEKRAKAQVGLIILGAIEINDYNGAFEKNGLLATKEEHVEGFKKLADTIHQYGTKVFAQIGHPGRQTVPQINKNNIAVAPSPIPCQISKTETEELTIAAIKLLEEEFITAIKILKRAGLDGIELHGAHGYLINQFLSPYTNKRTDQYGGNIENRCRFLKEIIEKARSEVGEDYPIGIRLTVEEYLDKFNISKEGINLEEGVKIAQYLEKIGLDYINVTSGIYETTNAIVEPVAYEQGWRIYLAEAVKEKVDIPVIGASVIREPEYANELIKNKIVDFVGIGRPFLADELWAEKAKENKSKLIRPCISCLNCLEIVYAGKPIECSVNYECAKEYHLKPFNKNGKQMKIAIMGGGPAGIEAARILAIRKFKPTIYEKTNQLGGQLQYGKMPPGKKKISKLINYYEELIKKYEIEVQYNWQGTIEDLEKEGYHKIIMATGSKENKLPIRGIDSNNVLSFKKILVDNFDLRNKKIFVLGGGSNGLETALFLSKKENDVTVIEIERKIGRNIYTPNKVDLLKKIEEENIKIMTNQVLVEIKEKSVVVRDKERNKEQSYPSDYVVLSVGVVPLEKKELEILEKQGIIVIGDAQAVGKIEDAVKAGYEVNTRI